MDNELNILLAAQAGLYTLKALGYFYLKNDNLKEGDIFCGREIPEGLNERKKLTLDFYKLGAVFPTPLDFLYWIGKSRNIFKKISGIKSDDIPQYSKPYSKNSRILEFVDCKLEDKLESKIPYSYQRKIELAE